MTLKEILNEVLSGSGFLKREAFVNSTDVDDLQMVSVANLVAEEIRDVFAWMALRKTDSVTLVDGQTTYDLPDDFYYMVPDSPWQDGNRAADFLPSDSTYYALKYSSLSGAGTVEARISGGSLIVPQPIADAVVYFEYVSMNPISSNDGTSFKENFTADDDLFLLDQRLFKLGIRAQWAENKDMPQADKWYAKYQRATAESIGHRTGGKIVGGSVKLVNPSPYYPLYRTG